MGWSELEFGLRWDDVFLLMGMREFESETRPRLYGAGQRYKEFSPYDAKDEGNSCVVSYVYTAAGPRAPVRFLLPVIIKNSEEPLSPR